MEAQSIKVRHNVEMAHRLSKLEGKCEQIHGHSWWVELEIKTRQSSRYQEVILEFGFVKAQLREYLDTNYDHRLLLNIQDEWASENVGTEGEYKRLPGLAVMQGDPTTENFAKMIGEWARTTFGHTFTYIVTVWETSVNCATWSSEVL